MGRSVTHAAVATARTPGLRRYFTATRGDSPAKRLGIHLILILSCAVSVYPFLRVIGTSLRPGNLALSTSLAILPAEPTWQHYADMLLKEPFLLWLWNSLWIAFGTTLIGLVLAAPAAYAFSRWEFPGRRPGLVFLLATNMIPAGMLLIPIYIVVVRLGLLNSYVGVVLAYAVTALPFSIWVLKGWFDTVPYELDQAARIDGASDLVAFWRVILPLSLPALAVSGLFNFMTAWNEYIVARVIVQQPDLFTWTIGVQRLQGAFNTQWGAFSAASVLVSIPVMIVFFYSSRWLVSGLTLGSVKG
ncbi:MAG: sugar ABC transporter permease [Limnochordaceae bacterium]|nr:sugar ABC transporter permease [Limnochordaceae bacterium]